MSKLIRHVALVPDDNIGHQLKASDITRVAAALQKQATRDFSPIWGVTATVDGFASLDDVPLGYWPIIVGQEGQGGGGVHLDDNNQPYSLVDLTPDWTVTASHECLEMLADPFGNRMVAGDSPNPKKPGRVEFLVEVCDPIEDPTFGYTVNGVRCSDFYYPNYFDPMEQGKSKTHAKYDFMGHLTAPRQVLSAGYLSWREPSGEWYQEQYFGAKPKFVSIGKLEKKHGSIRAWIDSTTLAMRQEALKKRAAYEPQVLVRLPGEHSDDNNLATEASRVKADLLRTQIRSVRTRSKK